jgi:putative nucleotidyltransferase with HDIG domain
MPTKRHILFVEDNPVLLLLYSTMLNGERDRWEVIAAPGGERALEIMEHQAFDVIISDMRMPGMDGVQLIREVRKRYPRTSRIILSGSTDQEEIAHCLDETHQFIPKPFDVKALKATLSRICSLDAYLENQNLRALAARLGSLPSFPSLYGQIMQELASDEPSIGKIAEIVSKDPAMTAKILQVVNSAAFALARKVSDPFEAVQYVGMGTIRSLALSAHVFSRFERSGTTGFSVSALWDHAMKSAALARAIMKTEAAEEDDVEDAYIAAMLHDIGKMMLADSFPKEFQRAFEMAMQSKLPLHEAERQVFGADHAGAGAYLLGLWGLPTSIVEAVAFHHSPLKSELRVFSPLTAVHAANVLENERLHATGCATAIDADYLECIGMTARFASWREVATRLAQ